MSMLPEAKLDILLAHHASLEAELLGQVNSENYVRITRELAELNPLIDAVKAYRAAAKEMMDIDALIADPSTEAVFNDSLATTTAPRLRRIPSAFAGSTPCRTAHRAMAPSSLRLFWRRGRGPLP